jgi:hypothetical protein
MLDIPIALTHGVIHRVLLATNNVLFRKYVVARIRKAVRNGEKEATLYTVSANNSKFCVDESSFLEVIQQQIDELIRLEEYELIPPMQNLLDTIRVNNLVNKLE